MKGFIKKSISLVLVVLMLSGSFICSAAELNQDAVAAHYGQYENYVLLGDSVACGYRDEMSDNDADFNEQNNETTYYRVPGSYADILTEAIIADNTMTALAGPGFRTIEMRYMLEDDYAANCTDEYLFWPSHLYVYQNQVCECHGVKMLPGSEHFRDQFKASIAEADLITLGLGGNDWGAYLRWVLEEILRQSNVGDEVMAEAREILDKSTMDIGTIEKIVEIAHIAGALPTLIAELPAALEYGLSNFYTNWDIVIQDIYDLNPDVTLVVLGMSDNSLKGKNYDYNGVEGAPVIAEGEEADPLEAQATSLIVDFILSIGNKPLIDGAEKFGYIYVDTDGTTYVDSHPDAAGHEFIANKIIEALPDAEISKQFDDVKPGNKYYNDVEYVVSKGIMSGKTEASFCPEDTLTKGELAQAMNTIVGTQSSTESTEEVSILELAISVFTASFKKGIAGMFKGIVLAFRIISENSFGMGGNLTRAQAAHYLRAFDEI